MKKFGALLTEEKEKVDMNQWGNDHYGIIQDLCVYKKIKTILFPYLLVNLFKQRYISSVKHYTYLNKFISKV